MVMDENIRAGWVWGAIAFIGCLGNFPLFRLLEGSAKRLSWGAFVAWASVLTLLMAVPLVYDPSRSNVYFFVTFVIVFFAISLARFLRRRKRGLPLTSN
jgi:hypothetical protein